MHTGYAFIVLAGMLPPVFAHYRLQDKFVGHDFFDAFNWETLNDPTHGRVNYVDLPTALKTNLSYASERSFVMRADDFNVVATNARGRNSIRITSHAAYSESMVVLDLQHMPEGCSTWPAFWTLSQAGPWPRGGEIDIIEGVNTQGQNLASLHTSPGCTMPAIKAQTGSTVSTNCDASVNNNQGCGSLFAKPRSYGSSFNGVGGGWYAMHRTPADGVAVYFWSRNDPLVPAAVKNGDPTIYPDPFWGIPEALFPPNTCDFGAHFDAHQLIFDLTFCGDWAGATFGSAGCGSGTCDDFVNKNPAAFTDAYWEVNSLRVYTPF